MDYLTPFHVGWDEFVNMLIELSVGSRFCSCDASFNSSYVGPVRASRRFVLIITLALFFELISHIMFLRETQILHFQTKFYILQTTMIS
jgi:hypothetical protein